MQMYSMVMKGCDEEERDFNFLFRGDFNVSKELHQIISHTNYNIFLNRTVCRSNKLAPSLLTQTNRGQSGGSALSKPEFKLDLLPTKTVLLNLFKGWFRLGDTNVHLHGTQHIKTVCAACHNS